MVKGLNQRVLSRGICTRQPSPPEQGNTANPHHSHSLGQKHSLIFYFLLGFGFFVVVVINPCWILTICLVIWECFRLTFSCLSLLPQRLETFFSSFFLNKRRHCHLITILKETGPWENYQIWQNSSSGCWWRTCLLSREPLFSDSPWCHVPLSPLWHLQSPTPPQEQDPHLRSVTATTLSYQSTTLGWCPSFGMLTIRKHEHCSTQCSADGEGRGGKYEVLFFNLTVEFRSQNLYLFSN